MTFISMRRHLKEGLGIWDQGLGGYRYSLSLFFLFNLLASDRGKMKRQLRIKGKLPFTPKNDLALPYYKKANCICRLRFIAGQVSFSRRVPTEHPFTPSTDLSASTLSSASNASSCSFALPDWAIALSCSYCPAVPKVLQVRQRQCRNATEPAAHLNTHARKGYSEKVVEEVGDMLTQLGNYYIPFKGIKGSAAGSRTWHLLLSCMAKPKSMTLRYFQKLSQSVQCRQLVEKGTCIGERKYGEAPVLLFQVDHFYVEVYFNPHTGDIACSRCFEDTEELQPYLRQIDISELC